MTRWLCVLAAFGIVCAVVLTWPGAAQAELPVVHAILFWSRTCPHCHYVMEEVLPPLQAQYGAQFRLKMLEGRTPANVALYQAAVQRFNIPPERRAVPTLIIGDHVLVGSREIPEQLPGLIAQYLAAGGVDYPALPGLEQAVGVEWCGSNPCDEETASTATGAPEEHPAPDPVANALAGLVLAALAAALVYAFLAFGRASRQAAAQTDGAAARPRHAQLATHPQPSGWSTLIPAFALLGLGVAGYLAYTKLAHADVLCGPVGDCDAVQLSPYAELFGIPVAVLGGLSYLGILVLWLVYRLSAGGLGWSALLILWGLAVIGAAFSLYLTFLEPFVIGAVCPWCLTSAVCMALILLVASHVLQGRVAETRQRTRSA
ncbi:MAG: vitamin K epoxide reductase [Anaerolineae bacterium]|nr:vitamin K epoxide reductase [Anaerolineae bacterium]MDW8070666.1 vitamin K epoxide reductase family protein [Anaerolineae bacterium]